MLCRLIAEHRPLIPQDLSGFSEATQECVLTFRALHEALTGRHRDTIEAYVVSHSEGPQDLLEVLLLMKESQPRASGRPRRDAADRAAVRVRRHARGAPRTRWPT